MPFTYTGNTWDRRAFLGALGKPLLAAGVAATLEPLRAARCLETLAGHGGAAAEVAQDETFWFEVQQAFTCDRSLTNLNNGGVSPAPAVVQDAMKRHLDYSNLAPAHTMWHVLEPQRETVRSALARSFGCDPEEIAVTRNASESLQICQLGFDLEPGDEVLTTNQDYPRMLTTFRQRERREKIRLRTISLPVPAEDPAEVVRRFEAAITPRTRLLLMCHVINLTGQILPVRQVVEMARRRGIPVLVDGAHSFAHFPFVRDDLQCDYFATSLHKWLSAPHGTGMLYVRRDKIRALWPLMAAGPELDENIRKFEEIGTHPAANFLAIAEALTFQNGIGAERKAARLRYLRDRWATRLAAQKGVRLHTSLKEEFSCAIALVQIEGVDSVALQQHLWQKHHILVTPIKHEEFEGIRVTPHVYTTLQEIDRFAEAMETVLRQGLPKS
jgi:selenocysteine lyase/cysteine desulfurase